MHTTVTFLCLYTLSLSSRDVQAAANTVIIVNVNVTVY